MKGFVSASTEIFRLISPSPPYVAFHSISAKVDTRRTQNGLCSNGKEFKDRRTRRADNTAAATECVPSGGARPRHLHRPRADRTATPCPCETRWVQPHLAAEVQIQGR